MRSNLGLVEDVNDLNVLDAGGPANAAWVESLTSLLINVAQRNDDLRDLGVRFQERATSATPTRCRSGRQTYSDCSPQL